jgi:hypothetical protein
MLKDLEVVEGVCLFRPHGECSMVEWSDLVSSAIAYCRTQRVAKLLVDGTDLLGLTTPSLLERFLMAEDWAHEAKGLVTLALVVSAEYIHPDKFGIGVASHLGMKSNIFPCETEAKEWLSSVATQT